MIGNDYFRYVKPRCILQKNRTLSLYFFLAVVIPVYLHAQSERFSYGMNIALNYPTIGSQFSNYSGEGNPTLGMFVEYKPYQGLSIGHPSKNKRYEIISDETMRKLTFVAQPSFSVNSFRQQDIDRRYTNYYLDFSGLVYIHPIPFVDEFAIFAGVRPSYLASYTTEQFENGFYTTVSYDPNKNAVGRIDFCVPVGLSLNLSEAVIGEITYNHSFTNKNTDQVINGRPSTVELALKLNAIGLVNQFGKKDDELRNQVKKLSKGALLVMLITPNPNEINTLKAEHRNAEIEYIYNELNLRNKKVMREFRSFFDFCPVYFFWDTSAYKVISRKLDNLFLGADLAIDPSIRPDSSNFFVAGFCDDISTYTTKHQYGLFVYDDKINQLPKPFNVPINLVGANLEGDPLNFFKKQRYDYSNISFERIITKFNNRLLRYRD
jgi:hypothetical protein